VSALGVEICPARQAGLLPDFDLCGRPRKTSGCQQFKGPAPIIVVEVQVEQLFDMVKGESTNDNEQQEQKHSGLH